MEIVKFIQEDRHTTANGWVSKLSICENGTKEGNYVRCYFTPSVQQYTHHLQTFHKSKLKGSFDYEINKVIKSYLEKGYLFVNERGEIKEIIEVDQNGYLIRKEE